MASQITSSSRVGTLRPILHKGVFSISRLHAHEGSAEVAVDMALAPDSLIPSKAAARQQPAAKSAAPAAVNHPAPVPQPYPQPSPAPHKRSLQRGADGRRLFFATPESLTYLDGSLPGDYGWDPLGLGRSTPDDSPMNLCWLSYAELIHGRWAMLAVAGALTPEVLARVGIIPADTGLPWFEAGGLYSPAGGPAMPFFGTVPFRYWTDQYTLFWTMIVAMSFAETRRLQDYRNPGSMKQQYFLGLEYVLGGSGSAPYPSGPFFNLFNFGRNESELFQLKTKEIKHGRLAMVAWLAFMVQAQTTHRGPVTNVFDHIAAPHTENILARVGDFAVHASATEKAPFLIWLLAGAAMCAVLSNPARDNSNPKEQN